MVSSGWFETQVSGTVLHMTLRTTVFFLILFFFPQSGFAETPMSGAEFKVYVNGRTLTCAENGQIYGIEEYRPNRRVRWAYMGDECHDGFWYEEGDRICFVCEGNIDLQCWRFTKRGGGLIARFMGAGNHREVCEAQQSEKPLRCPGPDVGV